MVPVHSQSLDFLLIMCAQFKWYFNLLLYYWEHLHIFTFIIFLWVTFQECVYITAAPLGSSARLGWGERSGSNDFMGRDGCGQHWTGDQGWVRGRGTRQRVGGFGGFKFVPRQGGSFWIKSSFPTKDGETCVHYRWSSRLGIPHAGKAGHWLCCRQICKSVGSSTGTWCVFPSGVAFCGVLNLLGSRWFGLAGMLVFWTFHVEKTCFSLTCLSKQQAFEFIRSNKLKTRSAFLVKFRVLSLQEWLLPGFLLNRQFWSDEVSISSTQLQEFQIWVQAINHWGEESTHFAELVD